MTGPWVASFAAWRERRAARKAAERKEAERLQTIKDHFEAVVAEIRRDDVRLTKILYGGEVYYGEQHRKTPTSGWSEAGHWRPTLEGAEQEAWGVARALARGREQAIVEVLG